MIKVDLHNLKGDVVGVLNLPESLFDVKKNDSLVHQVYLAQLASRHLGTAHKKNRGDVRGGGKKPWKQKGTGRARVGSSRNPLWKGGGVVFGPNKDMNPLKSVNTKMKKKALAVVLSDKLRNNKMKVIEDLVLSEVKTKFISEMVKGLNLGGSVLMAFGHSERDSFKSARNIVNVFTSDVDCLNVFDLVSSEYLVLSKSSIDSIVGKYVS